MNEKEFLDHSLRLIAIKKQDISFIIEEAFDRILNSFFEKFNVEKISFGFIEKYFAYLDKIGDEHWSKLHLKDENSGLSEFCKLIDEEKCQLLMSKRYLMGKEFPDILIIYKNKSFEVFES